MKNQNFIQKLFRLGIFSLCLVVSLKGGCVLSTIATVGGDFDEKGRRGRHVLLSGSPDSSDIFAIDDDAVSSRAASAFSDQMRRGTADIELLQGMQRATLRFIPETISRNALARPCVCHVNMNSSRSLIAQGIITPWYRPALSLVEAYIRIQDSPERIGGLCLPGFFGLLERARDGGEFEGFSKVRVFVREAEAKYLNLQENGFYSFGQKTVYRSLDVYERDFPVVY